MTTDSLQWRSGRVPVPLRIATARNQAVLIRALQGKTVSEISTEITLGIATIYSIIKSLRSYGHCIPKQETGPKPKIREENTLSNTPKKARGAFWKDLSHPKTQALIRAYQQRATYVSIGAQYDVTYERVRQWLNLISDTHGAEVFQSQGEELSSVLFQEAANLLDLCRRKVRLLCEDHGISVNRHPGKNTRRTISGADFQRLQIIVDQLMAEPCPICGKSFDRERLTKSYCSYACSRAAFAKNQHKRYQLRGSQSPDELDLSPCWHDVWEGIKKWRKNIGVHNEPMLTCIEALQLSGVTRAMLDYLRVIGVLSVHDHSTVKWRGRPAKAYLKGEIEILRDVYKRHNP